MDFREFVGNVPDFQIVSNISPLNWCIAEYIGLEICFSRINYFNCLNISFGAFNLSKKKKSMAALSM